MKDNELIFTIIRDNQEFDEQLNNNEQQFDQLGINNEQYNENGIEADNNYDHIQNQETSSFHEDEESPLFYQNNNSNKSNLNYLNTKKIGKKIHIQLIKGPQGLGFKLAARDNPTGEISPIYVKNILPKGAAIIDGRLQRGDRLLEVNGIDMTTKTLHETVNMLRNTKLGSLVDIVISRQLNAFPRELVSHNFLIYYTFY
jgi:C-terminal processing protease CtpA/Prc